MPQVRELLEIPVLDHVITGAKMKYRLTYARTIVLSTEFECGGDPWKFAADMERKGLLGIDEVEAKPRSSVEDILDDETIWDIEEL